MEQKTFCANCKVHCYKPEMREQIRKVMRFSGTEDYFVSSGHGGMASDMRHKREKEAGQMIKQD